MDRLQKYTGILMKKFYMKVFYIIKLLIRMLGKF